MTGVRALDWRVKLTARINKLPTFPFHKMGPSGFLQLDGAFPGASGMRAEDITL
jgi:hypothetical protein